MDYEPQYTAFVFGNTMEKNMKSPENQNFILSYAVGFGGIHQVPINTVISDVAPSLAEFIQTINFYLKVREINTQAENILNNFEQVLRFRHSEDIELDHELKLSVIDFAPIDDDELERINSVKLLLDIECLSQSHILLLLKEDFRRIKNQGELESLKNKIDELGAILSPSEKVILKKIIDDTEQGKKLLMSDIDHIIKSHETA